MPVGSIHINKNNYDHWTPHRLQIFQNFLDLGTNLTTSETSTGELVFTLDHPDFPANITESNIVLQYKRHLSSDLCNREEHIHAVYLVDDKTCKYTCIKKYHIV
jgi:hypothetical protein